MNSSLRILVLVSTSLTVINCSVKSNALEAEVKKDSVAVAPKAEPGALGTSSVPATSPDVSFADRPVIHHFGSVHTFPFGDSILIYSQPAKMDVASDSVISFNIPAQDGTNFSGATGKVEVVRGPCTIDIVESEEANFVRRTIGHLAFQTAVGKNAAMHQYETVYSYVLSRGHYCYVFTFTINSFDASMVTDQLAGFDEGNLVRNFEKDLEGIVVKGMK